MLCWIYCELWNTFQISNCSTRCFQSWSSEVLSINPLLHLGSLKFKSSSCCPLYFNNTRLPSIQIPVDQCYLFTFVSPKNFPKVSLSIFQKTDAFGGLHRNTALQAVTFFVARKYLLAPVLSYINQRTWGGKSAARWLEVIYSKISSICFYVNTDNALYSPDLFRHLGQYRALFGSDRIKFMSSKKWSNGNDDYCGLSNSPHSCQILEFSTKLLLPNSI